MHLETVSYHFDAQSGEPKYLQLANALELWLKLSDFQPEEKFPSDRQLAEFFQMGTVTVSRSVNELVARGLLARRVGSGTYITAPQPGAKWPQSRRIGLVCHEVMREDGSFVSPARRVLQEAAAQKQYDLVSLVRTPEQYETTIREYDLCALIVLAPQESFLPEMRRLSEAGFPIAALGVFLPEIAEFSFGSAHTATAAQAVDYLSGQGFQKIGIVLRANRGNEPDISVHERERGFLEGMWRNQLLVNPQWIFSKHGGEDVVFNQALHQALSQQEQAPDALLLTSLSDALIIYTLMREWGKSIPDDLALIGFDDAEYASLLKPSLTVWHQNIADSAEQAFAYLWARINGDTPVPHEPTKATLIERNSCLKKANH